MPERIDRPMPDNVWLGVTVTDFNDYTRKMYLLKNTKRSRPKILFASYEPILGPLPPEFIADLDWIIMGRLTGHGNKKNPDLRLLDRFAWECQDRRTPLFMKDNLRSIWPGKLIQEFPK
jgi:protein gp37